MFTKSTQYKRTEVNALVIELSTDVESISTGIKWSRIYKHKYQFLNDQSASLDNDSLIIKISWDWKKISYMYVDMSILTWIWKPNWINLNPNSTQPDDLIAKRKQLTRIDPWNNQLLTNP